MNLPLFSDMATKIKNDLDLNEETFIQPAELIAYFNEAIDMIEADVHGIYEDYFLRRMAVTATDGQTDFEMPADVYANKLRKFYLNKDESNRYEVMRMRNLDETLNVETLDSYKYLIFNDGATEDNPQGYTIKVYPAIRPEHAGAFFEMYYIRNAARYEDEDSICDIPEFSNVINQYVRYKCRAKEGHPDAAQDKQDLMAVKSLLMETLKDRVIDENTEIRKDLSFYSDFDSLY